MKKFRRFTVILTLLLLTVSAVTVHGASQVKKVPVVFHDNDGKIIKTEYITNGKKVLSNMKNPEGRTFLGWSTSKGQRKNPQYQAGQVLPVKKETHLYAVVFDRRREPAYTSAELPRLDTRKYGKVIFVGDSRTVMLRRELTASLRKSQLDRLAFVCQSGQGISWFKNVGEAKLRREIALARKQYPGKKIAVVFNLGVNDIRHRDSDPDCNRIGAVYKSYMNRLGKELTKKNCKAFYMSINPTNTTMSATPKLRRPWEILRLNYLLKTGLNENFTWLDCSGWLMKTGYSTGESEESVTRRDDGTHYSGKTSRRIYKYCISKINEL